MLIATPSRVFAACILGLMILQPSDARADKVVGSSQAYLADHSDPVAGAKRRVASLGHRAGLIMTSKRLDDASRRNALKALVHSGFDLERISRFALGRFWREATQGQRVRFQDLFAEQLLNTYTRQLNSYRAETLQVVGSQEVGRKDILVETRFESDDGPLTVGWRVRNRAGRYDIIDVVVDGISLALTQRQELGAVAKQKGIDGLLKSMRVATGKSEPKLANTVTDSSARAWMLVSFVGASGSPIQFILARK